MWAKNSRRECANAALREWHIFSSVYQDLLKYDKRTENQYWRKKMCAQGPKDCIIIYIAAANANPLYKHRIREQCSF